MAAFEMRTECLLNSHKVAEWTNGRWTARCRDRFGGVALDSRVVRQGDLFVALKGGSSDGHLFVAEAFRRGAAAAVVSASPEGLDPEHPCLLVDDTLAALHALASGCRALFTGTVVALTGSVGKTTVKEMVASVLRQMGTTVCNAGNFNNVTGVPLTVIQMCSDAPFAVVELGMSHVGEIRALVPLVKPHVAAVLNVASVHLENFSDLEAIAEAKVEVFHEMRKGSTAVLNIDDLLVKSMDPGPCIGRLFFGKDRLADLRLLDDISANLDCQTFSLVWKGKNLTIRLRALGEHNRMNAAAAATLALAAGANETAVLDGLAAYRPSMMRSELFTLSDGSLLLEDCYNASPPAFFAALRTLSELKISGRRVVVMGDMLELGSSASEFHRDVGRQAAELGVELLLGFGPLTEYAVRAFIDSTREGRARHFASIDDLNCFLFQDHVEGDAILIKGSRQMRMERVSSLILSSFPPSESD